MKAVLHILTKPDDALAQSIVEMQRANAELRVKTADLTGPSIDYGKLLEEIFSADAIHVW